MNARYTPHSRESRAVGVRLLNLTSGYDDLLVPRGLGVAALGALGLVARGRSLLRIVHLIADTGDAASASLAVRALTESVLTLAWLNKDPELAEAVWMLDSIRTSLSHHKEVADEERRQRASARRRGEVVAQLLPGQSFGLLSRAEVRRRKLIQQQQRERVEGLPRLSPRKNKLRVTRIGHMPGFHDRAEVAGMPWVYSLAYRFDSNAGAHPTPLAIGQFLEERADGIAVQSYARGPRPDPYYVAAQLFAVLVELAGDRVDQTALEPGLAELREDLELLRALGAS